MMKTTLSKRDWLGAIFIGLLFSIAILGGRLWWAGSHASEITGKPIVSFSDAIANVTPYTVSVISVTQSKAIGIATDPIISEYLTLPANAQNSVGTGILFQSDGWVVTNAHVIHDADDIFITDIHGHYSRASISIVDLNSDIAVLKTNIRVDNKPPINDQDTSRVGDIVFALGNPFGVGPSASMGIISGLNRRQPELISAGEFIQTDAAINPGNSGGPLINANGQIIGMNTAIYSSSGGSQGIGFALPIKDVINVANALVTKGAFERGYLGLDAQMKESKLIVRAVQAGSPADKAGILVGDQIISLNSQPINNRTELMRLVERLMPDTTIQLTIIRNGDSLMTPVKLGKANAR